MDLRMRLNVLAAFFSFGFLAAIVFGRSCDLRGDPVALRKASVGRAHSAIHIQRLELADNCSGAESPPAPSLFRRMPLSGGARCSERRS